MYFRIHQLWDLGSSQSIPAGSACSIPATISQCCHVVILKRVGRKAACCECQHFRDEMPACAGMTALEKDFVQRRLPSRLLVVRASRIVRWQWSRPPNGCPYGWHDIAMGQYSGIGFSLTSQTIRLEYKFLFSSFRKQIDLDRSYTFQKSSYSVPENHLSQAAHRKFCRKPPPLCYALQCG